MKILTIVGARPQFVKAAAVSRAVRDFNKENSEPIEEIIVHTGQHFDKNMSEIFFSQMDIPKPGYNLDINGLGHGAMTGRMLEGIEEVLQKEKPDWVLVYGDTNSTLAGALAAKKIHIKVAHVEAGLRSYNMRMPEEINRILTDRISDILFCPTTTGVSTLEKEGFNNFPSKVVFVGDVMFDVARFYENKMVKPQIDVPSEFVLTTIHRAENTTNTENLTNIIEGLKEVSQTLPIVIPVHPNTRRIIKKLHLDEDVDNLIFIDPVSYFEMIYLLKNCKVVMTDSGGLQKEAFFFGKQCITMRDETEWVELVEHGFNVIVGANKEKIINEFNNSLSADPQFNMDLYGTGDAANKIVHELVNYTK